MFSVRNILRLELREIACFQFFVGAMQEFCSQILFSSMDSDKFSGFEKYLSDVIRRVRFGEHFVN